MLEYLMDTSEFAQAMMMFGGMVLFIILGVPIPIAVGLGTIIGYILLDFPLLALSQAMYTGVEPFPLVTVPLFVFAGSLMEQGGMAKRIVGVAESLIGNVNGSLELAVSLLLLP